jgi:hypothetical protein
VGARGRFRLRLRRLSIYPPPQTPGELYRGLMWSDYQR